MLRRAYVRLYAVPYVRAEAGPGGDGEAEEAERLRAEVGGVYFAGAYVCASEGALSRVSVYLLSLLTCLLDC